MKRLFIGCVAALLLAACGSYDSKTYEFTPDNTDSGIEAPTNVECGIVEWVVYNDKFWSGTTTRTTVGRFCRQDTPKPTK